MDTLGVLSNAFLDGHPDDAARILERHAEETVARALASRPASSVAAILRASLPINGAAWLGRLDAAAAAKVIDALGPADSVRLLRHQRQSERDAVLEGLDGAAQAGYRRLLQYPAGCVGGIMNPFVFVLPEDLTVAEGMKRVRQRGPEGFFYPYVVDREQRLVGILLVRDLMLASPRQRLAQVVQREVVRLPALATVDDIGKIAGRRAYQSLPVVDDHGVLIGVVSQDALRRLEEGEATREAGQLLADALTLAGESYFRVAVALAAQMAHLASTVLDAKGSGDSQHAA